jgi:hypothetical protein
VAIVSKECTLFSVKAEVMMLGNQGVRDTEAEGTLSVLHYLHFSSEDGDTMFLRNISIYLRIYTTS